MCFRIQTESAEGRIRADSGAFRAAPQEAEGYFAVFYGLNGQFDSTEMDSAFGFGQIRSRVGFG